MASETTEEAVRNFRKLSAEQQEWILSKSPIDWMGEMAELHGRLAARCELQATAEAKCAELQQLIGSEFLEASKSATLIRLRELVTVDAEAWTQKEEECADLQKALVRMCDEVEEHAVEYHHVTPKAFIAECRALSKVTADD